MALHRQKKEEVLLKLADLFKRAATVVFVNFHGLSVSDTTALRAKLKGEGVSYFVAKKTLVRKALADAALDGAAPELPGELALAFGDDPIAPARNIHEFAKKHTGQLSILGGIFEGRYSAQEEMQEIAAIPSREALYGMFLNVINSPVQGLAVVLGKVAEQKSN